MNNNEFRIYADESSHLGEKFGTVQIAAHLQIKKEHLFGYSIECVKSGGSGWT